ncbi:hypothetical protein HZY83_07355 [Gemella sp. GH3]|uniref:phage tail protein n=1 Tax=unclassified Gemella TaxID=2624949 RepID=UPI0015D0155D|nr:MULTISPECIES: hypothetical protein [unclassified Gemella]MBF0714490.1 hypothetical protein [Gemella sp. GH3.1]NYS51442.1 hypothetical protein [Gemella sp. GH3]
MASQTYNVEAYLKASDLNFTKTFKNAENTMQSFTKWSSEFSNKFATGFFNAARKVVAATGFAGGAFTTMAIKNAGEMRAMDAQFSQVFEGFARESHDSLNRVSNEVGALSNRIKPSFSQIASFAKVAGMDTAQALQFTERATRAAADSAAFYDKSIEETTETLKSYLKGNYQVADNLGILSTETTRNAKAMELFGKKFKDLEGIQQQEVLLKMFEDANKVSGALGQAAREADGYENVLGNLQQAWKNLSSTVGDLFFENAIGGMKMLTNILTEATENVIAFSSALSGAANNSEKLAIIRKVLEPILPLLSVLGAAFATTFTITFVSAMYGVISSIGGAILVLAGKVPILKKAFASVVNIFIGLKGFILTLIPALQGVGGAVTAASIAIMKFAIAPAAIIGVGLAALGLLNSQFGTQINQILQVAITKGPQIITNLVQGITSRLPDLINSGVELVQKLAQVIVANAPAIIQGASSIIQQLVMGVAQNLPSLLASGIEIIGSILMGVSGEIPKILMAGVQLIGQLIVGIVTNLPKILQIGISVIGNFISGLVQQLPTLLYQGVLFIGQLIAGIASSLPQILAMGIKLVIQLVFGLVTGLPKLVSMGWELIKALGKGIIEAIPNILTKAWESIKQGFTDLWNWITGKSDEGNKKVSEDFQSMSNSTQTYTEEMKNNVTSDTSEMASLMANDFSNMQQNASISSSDASTNVSNDFAEMNNEVGSYVSGMESDTSGSMAGIANTMSVESASIKETVSGNMGGTASSVSTEMNNINNATKSGMNDMTNTARDSSNQIKETFEAAFKNLTQSVENSMNNTLNKIRDVCNNINQEFNRLSSDLHNAGYNAGIGFYNGLSSTQGSIYSLASYIANNVANTIRSALDIHSPSRVTKSLGAFTGEGFGEGLLDTLGYVENSANKLALAGIPDADLTSKIAKSDFSYQASLNNELYTSKQPMQITFRLGNKTLRGFVDDINDINNSNIRLEEYSL